MPGVPLTDETPTAPGLVCTVAPVPSEGSFAMRGVPLSIGPPELAPVVVVPGAPVAIPLAPAGVRGLDAGVCGDPLPNRVST